MTPYDLLVEPFQSFAFMRRALVAAACVAAGGGPVGTLLVLRRLSLMGDAMSHAVLPGVAIGFLIGGLSLTAMSIGGLVAGLTVAFLSGAVSRATRQREDASFAAFYLISLAAGVLIISAKGSSIDLLRILFGSVLGIDDTALILVASTATVTLATLAVIYRPLLLDCFDPGFLRSLGEPGAVIHQLFLVLVVLNLVAAFQALGTLMAVGLMMLPAASARFWVRDLWHLAALSTGFGIAASYAGLVVSYHLSIASGPAIVLSAGVIYAASLLFGRHHSARARLWTGPHLAG